MPETYGYFQAFSAEGNGPHVNYVGMALDLKKLVSFR